jgi:hypothetical protein
MNTPKPIQKQVQEQIIKKHGQICCTGCGVKIGLSYSHLCKKIHLQDVSKYQTAENITLHCFGDSWSCHSKWESDDYNKMSSLNDFDENMKRVKSLDILRYNRLKDKFKYQL